MSVMFLNFLGFFRWKNTSIAAGCEPAHPDLRHFSKLVGKRFFLSEKIIRENRNSVLETARFLYTLDYKKITLSWCKIFVIRPPPLIFVNFKEFWFDDKFFVHCVKRLKGHRPICNFFRATPLLPASSYIIKKNWISFIYRCIKSKQTRIEYSNICWSLT